MISLLETNPTWRIEDKVNDAIGNIGDLEALYTEFRQRGSYPDGYISKLKRDSVRASSIVLVFDKQLDLIVKHLGVSGLINSYCCLSFLLSCRPIVLQVLRLFVHELHRLDFLLYGH